MADEHNLQNQEFGETMSNLRIFSTEQLQKLSSNGLGIKLTRHITNPFDPKPVVKVTIPNRGTILLNGLDPDDNNLVFGVNDLGGKEMSLKPLSLSDIIEQGGVIDELFKPHGIIGDYVEVAMKTKDGRLVA